MTTLMAAIKMLRPVNLVLGALAVLITAALMPAWPAWGTIGLAIATVLCFNAAANALNDYFDYPIDKVNRPDRPLASGALPRNAGWWLAVLLFVAGTLAALQLPPAARCIALLIALPLMVLYTPVFKGLPLVGVAPFNRDSGSFRGKRCVWGGRRHLGSSLYMATLAATRSNPVIRTFYQRLLATGKSSKVALTASMRKLLTILNAIVKSQTPWQAPFASFTT